VSTGPGSCMGSKRSSVGFATMGGRQRGSTVASASMRCATASAPSSYYPKICRGESSQSVPIPASSPNCNPHAERFVRSARAECLEHFVIFGQRHLRYLLREFVEHYHTERYHQGLAGRLSRSRTAPSNDNCSRVDIASRSRLGGLLNFYFKHAA
jgi:putative transposase